MFMIQMEMDSQEANLGMKKESVSYAMTWLLYVEEQ